MTDRSCPMAYESSEDEDNNSFARLEPWEQGTTSLCPSRKCTLWTLETPNNSTLHGKQNTSRSWFKHKSSSEGSLMQGTEPVVHVRFCSRHWEEACEWRGVWCGVLYDLQSHSAGAFLVFNCVVFWHCIACNFMQGPQIPSIFNTVHSSYIINKQPDFVSPFEAWLHDTHSAVSGALHNVWSSWTSFSIINEHSFRPQTSPPLEPTLPSHLKQETVLNTELREDFTHDNHSGNFGL